MKIRFIRFDPDVKIPERKHSSDTGADIYMLEGGTIHPHQTMVIKTGFGIEIPNGHTGRMQVRTSVAKQGIMIQGCAIDATSELVLCRQHKLQIFMQKDMFIERYPTQYPSQDSKPRMDHKDRK